MKPINLELSSDEKKELDLFYEKHKNCSFTSAIGGKYTFIITPTGLGDCICVRCNSCDEVKDITDVGSW